MSKKPARPSPTRTGPALTKPGEEKREKLLAAVASLEERPQHMEALVALAEAYFRLATLEDTELADAARYLHKASRYDPFSPKLHFHLGRILWLSGDFPGATHAYCAALKLAPHSQRTYAHLALALLELGDAEKEIGRSILDALARGADGELLEQRAAVDELLKNREKADGKPAQTSRRKKSRENGGEKTAGNVRWQNARLVCLVEQLSRTSPNMRAVTRATGELARSAAGRMDAIVASLLMLSDPEIAAEVKTLCEEHHLVEGTSPLGELLNSALQLMEIGETGEAFVQKAGQLILDGRLPFLFVGLVHYHRFGPKSSLRAGEAVRLLDCYPDMVKQDPFFPELRLAVLDGYAREAYAARRYSQAYLLWEAARELDPMRVNITHNLALVSTYRKSPDEYERNWQRAIELRYLYAAGLGDPEVYIQDRISIHQGFSRQSIGRHCDPDKPLSSQDNVFPKFMADRTAIHTWLEDWDLYYLNTRLAFRSPVHRLGVARNASPEMIEEAREALVRLVETQLSDKPWTGVKTFCALAQERIAEAASLAADDLERGRDPYYEIEKQPAETLTADILERSLSLIKMLQTFLASLQEGKVLSASDLRLASAMAKSFLSFPGGSLQDLYLAKGMVDENTVIRDVVINYITNILLAGSQDDQTEVLAKERLDGFESLIRFLPQKPEMQMAHVRLLASAREFARAYGQAVETILKITAIERHGELAGEEEIETLKGMKANLIQSLDGFALSSMPEADARLLREGAKSTEEAKRLVSALKKVLVDFPRAEQLNQALAVNLFRQGDEGMQEAISLLEQARDQAFSEESRKAMVELLGDLRTEQKKAGPRAEAVRLVQGAVDSVQVLQDPNSGAKNSPQKIRSVLERAIADIEHGIRLADEIGDKELKKQAEGLLGQIRTLLNNLNRRM